ncbi:MAG: TRAP transporter substrate-binding protein [Betaproteobacteria bacterium]|nr:TRAP transporter substrate-binding protein [Betaproteobacteria bacterium]
MSDATMCKWKLAAFSGLVAGTLAAAPVVAQDDLPALKMRATNSYPQDQTAGQAMDFFAKRAGELSGGKITIQVYHAGKLYTEDKSIQAVLDGTAEMGMASASNHGPFTKVWQVVETPFLLDKKQFREVVIRGGIGKELKKMAEKDRLHPMMILESGGHRVVGGAKQIKLPEDIKQAKIRTAQSPVILVFYRALGSNPVVVPWGETYLALANKTVDGLDAVLASWPAGKLWEVTKNVTTINWAPVSTVTDVSVKWWDERTPKQRAILEQAVKEAEEFSIKAEDENEKALRELLKKNGVTVYDPSAQERDAWRKAGLSIWKTMPDVDQKMIERINKAAQAVK